MGIFDWFKNAGGPEPSPVQPRQRVFTVGESIGGEYRVESVLQGGLGTVYVVTHHELEARWVLKTFQIVGDETEGRFEREAQAWIALGSHPHVVQAFWARKIQGSTYVAAEYIQRDAAGRNTVRDWITRGRISTEDLIRWSAGFAHAMNHMRTHGIQGHRDIKPENLMVDAGGQLRVTDFGLAKAAQDVGRPFAEASVGDGRRLAGFRTEQGLVVGTPLYMAPEQFGGSADARSDIYAFGVVLAEALTGRPPFLAASIDEVRRAHFSRPIPRLDGPLGPLVSRCLQKDPAQRFGSAAEFLSEVTAIADRLGSALPRVPNAARADVEALYARCLTAASLEGIRTAIELTLRYVDLRPDDFRGWTHLGVLMLQAGDLQQALAATQRSLSINEDNSHAWNNLGLIMSRAGQFDKALSALRRAVAIDPRNGGAWMNLSRPYRELGRQADAIDCLNKAAVLQPEKAAVWVNLGATYLEAGSAAEAERCFRHALQLHPGLEVAAEGLRQARST